nr:MAG TPA: hypothetical protein [Caudoviricetes sp.]DAX73707.1 MAG TPA: hypothetical protein [Caudoviricetes sp.]
MSRGSGALTGAGHNPLNVEDPGTGGEADTSLSVVVVERTSGVGNLAAAQVQATSVLHTQLGLVVAAERGADDGALGRSTTTSRGQDPVGAALRSATQDGDQVRDDNLDLGGQAVLLDELHLVARLLPSDNALDSAGVDNHVRQVLQSRGNQEDVGRNGDVPTIDFGLRDLLHGGLDGVVRQGGVPLNIVVDQNAVRVAGLQDRAERVGDHTGVEARSARVEGEQRAVAGGVNGAGGQLGGVRGEPLDKAVVVVDEGLPRELEASTVLGCVDPATRGLVAEGRVRGELRNLRQGAGRSHEATVVPKEGGIDVVVERQELNRAEVVQQLLAGELLPGLLLVLVGVLEGRLHGLGEPGSEHVRGDGFTEGAAIARGVGLQDRVLQLALGRPVTTDSGLKSLSELSVRREHFAPSFLSASEDDGNRPGTRTSDLGVGVTDKPSGTGGLVVGELHPAVGSGLRVDRGARLDTGHSQGHLKLEDAAGDADRGVTRAVVAPGRLGQRVPHRVLTELGLILSGRGDLGHEDAEQVTDLDDIANVALVVLRQVHREGQGVGVLENLDVRNLLGAEGVDLYHCDLLTSLEVLDLVRPGARLANLPSRGCLDRSQVVLLGRDGLLQLSTGLDGVDDPLLSNGGQTGVEQAGGDDEGLSSGLLAGLALLLVLVVLGLLLARSGGRLVIGLLAGHLGLALGGRLRGLRLVRGLLGLPLRVLARGLAGGSLRGDRLLSRKIVLGEKLKKRGESLGHRSGDGLTDRLLVHMVLLIGTDALGFQHLQQSATCARLRYEVYRSDSIEYRYNAVGVQTVLRPGIDRHTDVLPLLADDVIEGRIHLALRV